MTKVNVHIYVEDLTLEELGALRAKVQNFLDSEVRAKLLTFSYIEEGE